MFDDYAIEGEDLDWTKVTDPRERKRLQNIINGRKYRERRLAAEAEQGGPGMGGSQGGRSRDVSMGADFNYEFGHEFAMSPGIGM